MYLGASYAFNKTDYYLSKKEENYKHFFSFLVQGHYMRMSINCYGDWTKSSHFHMVSPHAQAVSILILNNFAIIQKKFNFIETKKKSYEISLHVIHTNMSIWEMTNYIPKHRSPSLVSVMWETKRHLVLA